MKLIYQPKGKAYEYCHWACNLYNGCSNRCEYCYNRHNQAKALLGKDEPTLKSGLTNKSEAFDLFKREFSKCKDKIMEDGGELFFNFVSDPFLEDTWELNMMCINYVLDTSDVTVRTLTKCSYRLLYVVPAILPLSSRIKNRWKIGFTLTGMDDLEPNADTNAKRIYAIRTLSKCGYHTWASIEPVIDIDSSREMIYKAYIDGGCMEFKIGLLSGKKAYSREDVAEFVSTISGEFPDCDILWKDSVTSFIANKEEFNNSTKEINDNNGYGIIHQDYQ